MSTIYKESKTVCNCVVLQGQFVIQFIQSWKVEKVCLFSLKSVNEHCSLLIKIPPPNYNVHI